MAEEIEGGAYDASADAGGDVAEPAEQAGLNSNDDIVAALEGMDADADGPEGASHAAEPASDEVPAAGDEAQAPHPAVTRPEGWDEAMWSALAPEVQEHVNARVQAHAQELAAREKAVQDMRAQQAQFTANANSELQKALTLMKQVVEGEYGQLDWQALANSDPASYVRYQQLYNSRMDAVRQIQAAVDQRVQAARNERAQAAQAELRNEYERVLPEVRALMGAGFNGRQFSADLAGYLQSQGVPQEAIGAIDRGYELKLAAKAMLYDRMQQARTSAAQKIADAPKVAAPAGTAKAENGGRMHRAMSSLRSNPNSTEALAAVLNLL